MLKSTSRLADPSEKALEKFMQALKATEATEVMNSIGSLSPELPPNDQIVDLPNDLLHDLPDVLPEHAERLASDTPSDIPPEQPPNLLNLEDKGGETPDNDKIGQIDQIEDTMPPSHEVEALIDPAPNHNVDHPAIHPVEPLDVPIAEPLTALPADILAELCKQDSFAINLATSIFKMHPELSVEDFADELNSAQGIEKQAGEQFLKLAITPVERVLKTACKLLIPEMQSYWIKLSVFTHTFDLDAAAFIWSLGKSRAYDVLNCLTGYGLIKHNPITHRYKIHEDINRFTDNLLPEEERGDLLYLHSTHYQGVLHSADLFYEEGGGEIKKGLDLLRLELPNIIRGQKWAADNSNHLREACELCVTYQDAGKFTLALILHPTDRIQWLEAALNASKLLKRRKAMGRNLIALGDAHIDIGEIYKAIEYYERSHDITRSINDLGGKADALRGLGNAYYLRGELSRARKYFENAIEAAKDAGASVIERLCFGRIGMIHFTIGEMETARSLFEQQLNAAQTVKDHISEGGALSGLGLIEHQLGNYTEAIEIFSSQLYIAVNLSDKRGETSAKLNLGSTYAAQKAAQKVIDSYADALRMSRETGDRRAEATSLGGLGIGHFLNREFDASTQFIEHHLRLSTEIGDRLGAALARVYLGSVCIAKNDIKRAVKLFQEAYNVYLDTGDIRGRADTLYKLSLALKLFGDGSQAVSHALSALELYEKAGLPAAENVRRQLEEWK